MKPDKNKATYIAGPITGIKDFNFPAFFAMEESLKNSGLETILNPASNKKDPNTTSWKEFMIDAIDMVMRSEQVVFLEGWEKSKGARVEMELAKGLGLGIFFEKDPNEKGETMLQQAERIVSTDRGNDYDHPYYNFSKTAKMWEVILGCDISQEQVGMCMIALKLCRLCHSYKFDSLLDICGYAKTIEMVVDKKKELQSINSLTR